MSVNIRRASFFSCVMCDRSITFSVCSATERVLLSLSCWSSFCLRRNSRTNSLYISRTLDFREFTCSASGSRSSSICLTLWKSTKRKLSRCFICSRIFVRLSPLTFRARLSSCSCSCTFSNISWEVASFFCRSLPSLFDSCSFSVLTTSCFCSMTIVCFMLTPSFMAVEDFSDSSCSAARLCSRISVICPSYSVSCCRRASSNFRPSDFSREQTLSYSVRHSRIARSLADRMSSIWEAFCCSTDFESATAFSFRFCTSCSSMLCLSYSLAMLVSYWSVSSRARCSNAAFARSISSWCRSLVFLNCTKRLSYLSSAVWRWCWLSYFMVFSLSEVSCSFCSRAYSPSCFVACMRSSSSRISNRSSSRVLFGTSTRSSSEAFVLRPIETASVSFFCSSKNLRSSSRLTLLAFPAGTMSVLCRNFM
mmetsp:Transcript_55482/g.162974  ORF Transcript_55482/g.162974 Transcript_55482/m.162974 type:complete len:422 (-) Transcript_55482:2582-3847(-)